MKNKQFIVVICHGAATIYTSITDAAKACGISRNTLSKALADNGQWYGKASHP